jgi:hypothetical protein
MGFMILIYGEWKQNCKYYMVLKVLSERASGFNGLLPKSLFTVSKTVLIRLRLVSGALKTRPSGSDSSNAYLPLQKD